MFRLCKQVSRVLFNIHNPAYASVKCEWLPGIAHLNTSVIEHKYANEVATSLQVWQQLLQALRQMYRFFSGKLKVAF